MSNTLIGKFLEKFEASPNLNTLNLGKFKDIFRTNVVDSKLTDPSSKLNINDIDLITDDVDMNKIYSDQYKMRFPVYNPDTNKVDGWSNVPSNGEYVVQLGIVLYYKNTPILIVNMKGGESGTGVDPYKRKGVKTDILPMSWDFTTIPKEDYDLINSQFKSVYKTKNSIPLVSENTARRDVSFSLIVEMIADINNPEDYTGKNIFTLVKGQADALKSARLANINSINDPLSSKGISLKDRLAAFKNSKVTIKNDYKDDHELLFNDLMSSKVANSVTRSGILFDLVYIENSILQPKFDRSSVSLDYLFNGEDFLFITFTDNLSDLPNGDRITYDQREEMTKDNKYYYVNMYCKFVDGSIEFSRVDLPKPRSSFSQ